MLTTPVKTKKQADLLPLMDCIFLILFIFFYLILFLSKYDAIKVNLPYAESVTDKKVESFFVGIDAEGKFYQAKSPIKINILEKEIQSAVNENEDVTIFLTADKKAPFESVVSIINIINTLEIENFAIEVKNE